MPYFDPDTLARDAGGEWNQVPSGVVRGFCQDTRRLRTGDLFVAIRAERDGHDFLRAAADAGATAALVERFLDDCDLPQLRVPNTGDAFLRLGREHRRRFPGQVVGVTGSCGKTSTKEVLRLLLGGENCHATEGNLNNHLGVPLTLLRLDSARHDVAVVEAGINAPGEMERLARTISPDLVVVTMVGPSHLEGLGTVENVAAEKARLFEDAGRPVTVIFPEDCLRFPSFERAARGDFRALVLKRGSADEEPEEGVILFDTSTETNGSGETASLWLRRRGHPALTLPLPSVSEGMASNCALAVSAALELGSAEEELSGCLPLYQPSALRGKCLRGRGSLYYLDCYNANPASMLDSVNYFRRLAGEAPKLYVLGGMEELGEESRKFHREVGAAILPRGGDRLLLVGEKAAWMGEGALEAGAANESVEFSPDTDSARDAVAAFRGAVLLKGSRANALETLAPEWATEEENADEGRC